MKPSAAVTHNTQPMHYDAQLAFGGNCPGEMSGGKSLKGNVREGFARGNFLGEISGLMSMVGVGIPTQDYKSLPLAVVIWATEVYNP